jgi:surface polysaccharide O-acyltransferase-like enzyme
MAKSLPAHKTFSRNVTLPTPLSTSAGEKPLSKPRYMPYGDVARVLGTVAVVVGHVCDMVQYGSPTIQDFWFCNFINSASRWAVPIYIMLSGALLLDPARAETPSHFYSKRLARLGIPIAFWTAFFMLFTVYFKQPHGMDQSVNVWKELVLGKPYAHLHFIFRIAGLYAFTPMLRLFLQHAPKRMVVLTVVLMLGFACFNSITDAFTGSEQSAFFRFVPFLGFYLAGYLLRDKKLTPRALIACWLLALSCVFLLAGGTGLLVNTFGPKLYPSPGYLLYDFMSPVRIALGVAVWLIFVNTFDERWMKSRLSRFISKWLAPATLGIYLVHPLFRELLHVYGWNATLDHVYGHASILVGVPLIALMVYIPSVIFTLIVMRIPYVQRIVI